MQATVLGLGGGGRNLTRSHYETDRDLKVKLSKMRPWLETVVCLTSFSVRLD